MEQGRKGGVGFFQEPYTEVADNIRYKILVAYCLFQLVYAACLILFGFFDADSLLRSVVSALTIVPVSLAAIYFAKKNYRVTCFIYVLYCVVLQSVFVLVTPASDAMNIIAMTVYLMIAILSITMFSIWMGGTVIIVGFVCILSSSIASDLKFFSLNSRMWTLHIHLFAYSIMLFGFFAYLVRLFYQYLDRYLKQNEVSENLNLKLKNTVDSLNELNSRMEENISALTDANTKLNKYAWSHAHELRAPVARILGLMNILKLDDYPNTPQLTEAINTTAIELDEITRKMSSLLEEIKPTNSEIVLKEKCIAAMRESTNTLSIDQATDQVTVGGH